MSIRLKITFFLMLIAALSFAQNIPEYSFIANGWANNSVNTAIFRKNSLVTFRDTQFAAFYDAEKRVVLAKRKLGSSDWIIRQTQFHGKPEDAHNVISLMADGEGFLHLAFDHHNNSLHYSRSLAPGSLEMSVEMPMTGKEEDELSYPEFYKLPDGNILFFYRDGGSGRGNLIINKYNVKTKQWTRLQDNLISGEKKRNAYWQTCTDKKGTIHISWVWRESPDVSSNHDMCYARSTDGGLSWEKSTGEKYLLPIMAQTAEHAWEIPQKSELINQTSMACDEKGNPFIASYWRDVESAVPQYHIIYKIGKVWQQNAFNFHIQPFSLSGMGTKRIPISRPQLLVKGSGKKAAMLLLFRDEERGNKPSALIVLNLTTQAWKIKDLAEDNLGSWEPTYDTELWNTQNILHLFVQHTEQTDAEGISELAAQPINVLEWKPDFK